MQEDRDRLDIRKPSSYFVVSSAHASPRLHQHDSHWGLSNGPDI